MTDRPSEQSDPQLRDLLHDAVADVEPTRDLDLSATPSRRVAHWLPVTVAAALATVLVVTGTAWLVQRDDAPPAAAPGPPSSTASVTAFTVVETPDGPRLAPEARNVPRSGDLLAQALRQTLLEAPTTPGRSAAWFEGAPSWVARLDATVSDGVVVVDVDIAATVDLYTVPAEVPLFAQAVAWTAATALDDPATRVRFTQGGRPTGGFLPSGTTTPDPTVLLDAPSSTDRGTWVDAYAVTQASGTPMLTTDRRQVPEGTDPLQGAVEATVAGPPDGAGTRGLWPAGTAVTARERGGVIEVDFTDGLGGDVPSESAVNGLALQTIVWAATAAVDDPDAGVRFLVRGEPVPSLLELDTSQPMTRQVEASVVAPVTIDSVGNGETVSSPFTVSGLATAFEGTVTWTLVREEQTVRRGFATAEQAGTPSPYSFRVQAPPGSYTLEVRETDPSDGEGRAPFGVAKRITVR